MTKRIGKKRILPDGTLERRLTVSEQRVIKEFLYDSSYDIISILHAIDYMRFTKEEIEEMKILAAKIFDLTDKLDSLEISSYSRSSNLKIPDEEELSKLLEGNKNS